MFLKLLEQINNLGFLKGDKTVLLRLIKACELYNLNLYTASTVETLQEALTAAKIVYNNADVLESAEQVLDDKNAILEEINVAIDALKNAMAQLVLIDTKEESASNNDKNSNPSDSNGTSSGTISSSSNKSSSKTISSPKTGENIQIIFMSIRDRLALPVLREQLDLLGRLALLVSKGLLDQLDLPALLVLRNQLDLLELPVPRDLPDLREIWEILEHKALREEVDQWGQRGQQDQQAVLT